MVTSLTEKETLERFSGAVETAVDPSLVEFIESLTLPGDEEKALIDSVKMLPDKDLSPSALPKNPPSLMSHGWWS